MSSVRRARGSGATTGAVLAGGQYRAAYNATPLATRRPARIVTHDTHHTHEEEAQEHMTEHPNEQALQDTWPEATCYGCGPANPYGLHIKSYWDADGETVFCLFQPDLKYNAGFPNVMYGGLVASLIDCHSIWTAIAAAYKTEGRPHGSAPSISYVTGSLQVRYLQPTPLDQEIVLRAHVTEVRGRKTHVACTVQAGDRVTAEGTVVAVRIDDDKARGVAAVRAQQPETGESR